MHQFDGVGSTVFRDLELSQQVIPRLVDGRVLFQRRAAWKWRMGGLWDLGPLKIVTYAHPVPLPQGIILVSKRHGG